MPADQSADLVPQADSIRLFLCGDVMTGRGIDQVLPHPTDPTLHEPYICDARSYVERAESVNAGADAYRTLPPESRCRSGCGVALRFTEPARRAARHAE